MVQSQANASSASVLDDRSFAGCIRDLGPFESTPHIAVAVSGGADSLALVHLAHRWALRQGGRVTALTVDHGLRPESAEEARKVSAWMTDLGVDHHILKWKGPRPAAGIQEAAREARYDLLTGWCREHDVMHLLVAHHRDDQAETVAMRFGRQSGLDGLAGMPACAHRGGVRLLRPLLCVPRAQLEAMLVKRHLRWIDDPSNRSAHFERIRLRRFLGGQSDWSDKLRHASAVMARWRRLSGAAQSRFLARTVQFHEAGFARINLPAWRSRPADLVSGALGRVLATVSGRPYVPGPDSLHRLATALCRDTPGGGTLAGCRVFVKGQTGFVGREPERQSHPLPAVPLQGNMVASWDRRFRITTPPDPGASVHGLDVRLLGRDGWVAVKKDLDRVPSGMPSDIIPVLPAVWATHGPVFVPHLGYIDRKYADLANSVAIVFAPRLPLTPIPFDSAVFSPKKTEQ